MASITISDGYIAANGREIVLTGESNTLPTSIDVCDWLPGWLANKGFRLNSGRALELATACWWVDGTKFKIKVCLTIDDRNEASEFQEAGDFLTIDDGVLQDIHGNKLAGGTCVLPNYSLVGSNGFVHESLIDDATNVLYVVPVAGVGTDTRTLQQARNVLTPLASLNKAVQLATSAGGRWAILVLQGTAQAHSGAFGSGVSRATPNVIGTFWHNYGAGIGSEGDRPTLTISAQQTINHSNLCLSGLKFVAVGGIQTFFMGYGAARSDIGFIDCEFTGAYRQVVFEHDANRPTDFTTRPYFHRCILGPTGNRGIGVFAYGTIDLMFSECATDRAGESGNGNGDTHDHAIYLSWFNTPAFVLRHFARRSGSHAIQLRCGGGISGLLTDQCPIATEICGPGGYIRNYWLQRGAPIVNPNNGGPRGFGHTTKYTDTPTSNGNSPDNPVKQFPVQIELGATTSAASGQGEEPRIVDLDMRGPQVREAFRARNVQGRRNGPFYVSGSGGQVPTKIGLTHAHIANKGDPNTPSRCVYVNHMAGQYAKLDFHDNRYESDTSTHAVNDSGVTLASFQGTTGSETGSTVLSGGSVATYTHDLVMLKDWYEEVGKGENDHVAAYEFWTTRPLGVWHDNHDVRLAIAWLREQQAPTNIPDVGAGPLAFIGAGPYDDAFATIYSGFSAPQVPNVPVIDADAGNAAILFSLNAQANITSRSIRYGTASGPSNLTNTILLEPDENEYLLEELANGVTIYFQVKATNSAGDSAWSVEASATPTAPAQTTSWSMEDVNGDDYDVKAQPTVTVGEGFHLGESQSLRWKISNTGDTSIMVGSVSIGGVGFSCDPIENQELDPGQSVEFGVYLTPAFVGTHTGTLRINTPTAPLLNVAADIEFTGLAPVKPDAPAIPGNRRLIAGNGKVTGLCDEPARAEFFEWFLSTNAGTLSTTVYQKKVVTTIGSMESTGWTNGTPVYAIVRAGNVGGVSAASAQFSATPLGTAPTPPRPSFITQALYTRTLDYLRQNSIWGKYLNR